MKYMFLLHKGESEEGMSPDAMADWERFEADLAQRGGKVASVALQPAATATIIRSRHGESIVSDGPFADTKEQLGGFYILECADLDDAIELGIRIQRFTSGDLEVRPVRDMSSTRGRAAA